MKHRYVVLIASSVPTNCINRKIIKTYSRQRNQSIHDAEPAAKRRRVDSDTKTADQGHATHGNSPRKLESAAIASSSPRESPAIFSDDVPITSTPPSSPPPSQITPPHPTRGPMFSFLKRKQRPKASTAEPLSEESHNVRPPPPSKKKRRLTQMQLDLGGDVRKSCKVCGMDYIPSNVEDAALHRKFHAMNVGGMDLGKSFVENVKKNKVWAGGDGSFIAVVGRKDSLAFRNKATQVLDVVNTELAAVTMGDDQLWSQIPVEESSSRVQPEKGDSTKTGKKGSSNTDRFKMYLYIQGLKCIGACLAERILEAYAVLEPDDVSGGNARPPAEWRSSSISVSKAAEAAILGISRIWTSNSHRKSGRATALLDSVISDFLYGMTIPKEMVAFSQPTESGGQLARKWFGRDSGWHVYVD